MEPNRALLTFVLMVGTLAAVMGSSTVNTALNDIMAGLSIAPDQISWVTTAYMLANVIAIPCAAYLGQLLSKRILFGVGVAIFVVASVLCAVSGNFEMLILSRIIQGLGAGVIMPTAQAMLFEAYPPDKRGMAMGIYGMGAIMGPAIGPTVGGYLVELVNWRAIFLLNIPFGAVSLALLNALPKDARQANLKFDALGFVTMTLFLCGLQIAITNGNKDGWDAPYILACIIIAALSFIIFMWHELRTPQPIVNLKVFTYPLYNTATIVSSILGLGLFGSTFLVPLYLGNLLGYSALQIGLLLLPGSLLMGVAMLISGRLSDLIDSRILLFSGLAIFGYGLHMQTLADATSPDSLYIWGQVWRGLGIAMCFSPLTAVSMRGLPPQLIGQATGLFNLTRQLAGSIGIAALSSYLTTRITFHGAVVGQAMHAQDPQTQAFIASARAMLIQRGMAPSQADLGAFAMLGSFVRRQVSTLAYADLFIILMVTTVLAMIPVIFLRSSAPAKQSALAPQAPPPPPAPQPAPAIAAS